MTDDRHDAPHPWDLDEEPYESAFTRFVDRTRVWLVALVAIAMVVPAIGAFTSRLPFQRAGDEVAEALAATGDDELLDAVLLVETATCGGSSSTGTAFLTVLDGAVVLVTNAHVVDDARSVAVQTLDGERRAAATGVALARDADVAAILLDVDPRDLGTPIPLGEDASPGTPVRTVGFPRSLPATSTGVVLDTRRAGNGVAAIQASTETEPGASGSPIVDPDGVVVAQVFARTANGDAVATASSSIADALRDGLGATGFAC